MPDFHAASGPVDVLATGTIIAFEASPIEISFSAIETAGGPMAASTPGSLSFPFLSPPGFKLIFRFVDETQQPGAPPPVSRLEAKSVGELTLEITLFNFNSPLGTGSDKPVNFGFSAGRRLYLHYRVYSLAGGDKTLQFTIYQRKEPDPELLKAALNIEPKKEANA